MTTETMTTETMTIETYTDKQIASLLVHPAADVNKYTRGKLVVVAGSGAYPGAACLTSHAAQRMGAGYVEVVCAPESADVVRASRASLVVRPWDGWRFADQAELMQQCAEDADDQAQQCAADVVDQVQQRAEDCVKQVQQNADQAKSEEQHAEDTADQVQQCVEDQEVASSQHPATHAAKHPAACVIGPGFDAHGKTEQKLVLAALCEVTVPLLVDGGAISVLATSEGIAAAHERAERGWPLVVTPHGGEAARMEYAARIGTGANAEPVQADREQSARDDANAADREQPDTPTHAVHTQPDTPAQATTLDTPTQAATFDIPAAPADTPTAGTAPAQADRAQTLASTYHCVVALKGSDTYLSDGQRTVVMCQGTAALAKAGTGDVLAGMIGALLAQNVDPLDACVAGTTIHAKAGCEAADRLGDISVTAEDVIASIPSVIYDLSFPNRIL